MLLFTLLVGSHLARGSLGLGAPFLVLAGGAFGVGLWLVLLHLPVHPLFDELGAANGTTLTRLCIVAWLLAVPSAVPSSPLAWSVVLLAGVAAALDGVDGWIARRTGTATGFGARFDMETDAALVLALAIIAWWLGKAGAWVLLSGMLRYLFVAAAWHWRWLAAPLAYSQRRRIVCSLQVLALIVCIAPVIPLGVSDGVAAAALLMLMLSFAIDVRCLYGHEKEDR
jgi:phosphatidylglycerophosphate synthase